MFTTNLTLLMPLIGVATGLVAAMLVVRSHDLQLASVGFNAKSSRVLVPHHTTEGVLLAISIPLALVIFGSCGVALREYCRPPATDTGTGGFTVIPYDSLSQPLHIDDNVIVDQSTLNGRMFSGGVPRPVENNYVPDTADIGPNSGWVPGGAIDPRNLNPDSVRIVRDDDPPKGYVELAKYPELVRQIDPVYPSIAIKIGGQGHVYVQALLDTDGRVLRAELSRSSGYPALDEAALEAVKQWVFTPAIAPDGRPTRVWQMCPISFKLN